MYVLKPKFINCSNAVVMLRMWVRTSVIYTVLQILKDEIERLRPSFNTMVATSVNHTQGQGSEVKAVKERFDRLESAWHRIIAEVDELAECSKPWVEFTDKFDSFCVWIERLERKVREGEQEVDNMAEEEGGDLSDKIVLFKVSWCAHIDLHTCMAVMRVTYVGGIWFRKALGVYFECIHHILYFTCYDTYVKCKFRHDILRNCLV